MDPGFRYYWALSPDGSQLGILKAEWVGSQIRFFPVHNGKNRTITVKGYANLSSLDWMPYSTALFVGTSGPGVATLLRVERMVEPNRSGRNRSCRRLGGPLSGWTTFGDGRAKLGCECVDDRFLGTGIPAIAGTVNSKCPRRTARRFNPYSILRRSISPLVRANHLSVDETRRGC